MNNSKRPKTGGGEFGSRKESLWSAGGGINNARAGSKITQENDLDDDDELESALKNQFSVGKSSAHQISNDKLLEKKRALFGGANPRTSSTGGLQTFGGAQNQTVTRNSGHLLS